MLVLSSLMVNCVEICPSACIKEHFESYTVHAWNIHKAVIASLIIYKWVIKHLETLYQGNPLCTVATSNIGRYSWEAKMESAHWLMELQPLGLRSYYLFFYFFTNWWTTKTFTAAARGQFVSTEPGEAKEPEERKEKNERQKMADEMKHGAAVSGGSCGARVGPVPPEPARQTRWADAAFGAEQALVPKGQIEIMFLIEVMCKKIAWLRLS